MLVSLHGNQWVRIALSFRSLVFLYEFTTVVFEIFVLLGIVMEASLRDLEMKSLSFLLRDLQREALTFLLQDLKMKALNFLLQDLQRKALKFLLQMEVPPMMALLRSTDTFTFIIWCTLSIFNVS